MENSNRRVQIILKGEVDLYPIYRDQLVSEYTGNPYIEALPRIQSEDDFVEKFAYYPTCKSDERLSDSSIRYHYIERLRNFVQPLGIHFNLEKKLSTLIRQGYLSRNPMSKIYLQRLRAISNMDGMKLIDPIESENSRKYLRSSADSFSIVGISGMGKTISIEKLLLMYPQVIRHREYKGMALSNTQIVWLKIDCPYDGSLGTLCKMFFRAVDDVLGTYYFKTYGKKGTSTSTMMMHMTYLAAQYSIGVLVIDEIQHLINEKQSSDEMLDFFVTLVNTISIPTVFIGTPKSKKVLERDFRQARRSSGVGSIAWDRMSNDDEWLFFLETLWDFQWLKQKCELNEEISNIMYDESQGIIAVAVNLVILAQERSLANGQEKLTASIIKETAKRDLSMIQKMINALKNNNLSEIAKYEDIILNIDNLLESKHTIESSRKLKTMRNHMQIVEANKKNQEREQFISEIIQMGISRNLTYKDYYDVYDKYIENAGHIYSNMTSLQIMIQNVINLDQEKASKDRVSSNKSKIDESYRLLELYETMQQGERDMYLALKDSGFIKNPLEEFRLM